MVLLLPPTTVVARLAGEERIPIVSPTATGDDITKVSDFVARVCFYDSYQAPVMAVFAVEKLGYTRAAILYDNSNDYSIGLANAFALRFTELGGTIVAKEAFTEGDQDFNAQLTNIAAANPEVVYVPAYYSDDAQILLQARQLGMTAVFMGGDGWDSDELVKAAGSAAEGSYFTTHYSSSDESEQVLEFLKTYKQKYNTEPTLAGPLAMTQLSSLLTLSTKLAPQIPSRSTRPSWKPKGWLVSLASSALTRTETSKKSLYPQLKTL